MPSWRSGCCPRGAQAARRAELDGGWIHLDADVLDDAVMSALDYRIPGGLSFDELAEALIALNSGQAVGFVTLNGVKSLFTR